MDESHTFEPEPASVGEARAFVRRVLGPDHVVADDAVLVISELATNVVRHAQTDFLVTVRSDSDGLEIAVADGSSIFPAVTTMADANSGFGLRIVERVSRDWGFDQTSEGKRIWVRLA
jgi:anti-sigma regulatory factor (Ser/Thr protein kinase)